jgi:hypothetical protein|tara:strand:+ start:238 stop:564 length:327 start_codon:yes stop_codon:yes gene_type:complete
MNKDQYLRMVEQTGEEIDWERCPPDWDDFPASVETAMSIFNSLGDKIYPEIGYVGKDFTTLELLYNFYEINLRVEKEWIFELLLHLESDTIAKSQRQIKAEYDKMKKK